MLPSSSVSPPTPFRTIDPALQQPAQYNWTFPAHDSLLNQRSVQGSTGSNDFPPNDPFSKHLQRDDILRIISQASDRDLALSGNAAYMRLELALARATNEKTQVEGLKRSLEEEVIRLQSRLQAIEEINNKLTCSSTNFPRGVQLSNRTWSHLPPAKDLPSPLNQNDFDRVKYWTKSSWNVYERAQRGATDGNARKAKKRGRPEKETPNDDCDSPEPNTTHVYLETEEGLPVSKALVTQQGQKMRSLWATLDKHGLAPMVWSEADSLAVMFVDSAMLNDPRFHYLRLCNDNWKLKHWISKNYPSWARNHLAAHGVAKAKKETLDDENLIKIAPDPLDNEALPGTALEPSNVIPHEESSDAHEDITMELSLSKTSFPTLAVSIVDPLQDDDTDKSLDGRPGMPTGSPEASTTQPPTSGSDSHSVPPTPADTHTDETRAPATTSVHGEGRSAPATVEPVGGTLLSRSAPSGDVLHAEDQPQSASGPPPKKRKVAAPATISDSISDKNLCRQDWLKSHEGGTEDEYKLYWLTLPEEERKRWKQVAAVQRKARNEKKKKA